MDGLDEDRGVTTGPDARSIAALLPHDPPAGMRVVVARRPDPPIPDDVPGWHRLREPGIIRPLAPSDYAQDIRTLAQQELRRPLAEARRPGLMADSFVEQIIKYGRRMWSKRVDSRLLYYYRMI